jgi:LacI family transcriptional regulator
VGDLDRSKWIDFRLALTMNSTKRVTLLDIAADAGVSRATVSLVMRDSPLVADETRARVQSSAEKLGYVYDRVAASLRSQRSASVGIVVTSVGNPFFAEITTGVEGVLSETGRLAILGQHSESLATQSRLLNQMLEYRVDGVILTPANGTPASVVERLTAAGVVVVLCVRRVDGVNASYVGSDNEAGARLAALHLLDHGLERLAFVGGVDSGSPWQERSLGVRAAIAERGADLSMFVSLPSAPTRDGGYAAAASLLRTATLPIGVVAYNDVTAFGVIAAVRDAGLRLGSDVAVIGFDDIEASRFQQPPLTTVAIDPAGIGASAAELLSRVRGGEPAEVIAPARLVVRETCGCRGTVKS